MDERRGEGEETWWWQEVCCVNYKLYIIYIYYNIIMKSIIGCYDIYLYKNHFRNTFQSKTNFINKTQQDSFMRRVLFYQSITQRVQPPCSRLVARGRTRFNRYTVTNIQVSLVLISCYLLRHLDRSHCPHNTQRSIVCSSQCHSSQRPCHSSVP